MSESDKKSLVEKMNEFIKGKRIELSEKSLSELENLQLETKEQYLEITIYEIRKVKWLYEHIQELLRKKNSKKILDFNPDAHTLTIGANRKAKSTIKRKPKVKIDKRIAGFIKMGMNQKQAEERLAELKAFTDKFKKDEDEKEKG